MDFDRTETEHDIVYTPSGALTDMPDLLKRFFDQLVGDVRDGRKDLVLDFKNVNFIDSRAIGLLINTAQRAREKERPLRLRNLQTLVRHILDSVKVKKIFTELY